MHFEAYREKHQLSQRQLADKLGISRQLVSLIELGKRRITPENANDWAPKLGLQREDLCQIFSERRPRRRSVKRETAHA